MTSQAQSIPKLHESFEQLRSASLKNGYPNANLRVDRLRRLLNLILSHQQELSRAIANDFNGRSLNETRTIEILPTTLAIRHAIKHLRKWMRPIGRRPLWFTLPARAQIDFHPLGVVGVLSPWNYPLLLSLGPITDILAAGNRIMLKPSELSPHHNELLQRLVQRYYDADEFVVVTGGQDIGSAVAALPFDHLLFTGSTEVGRKVMHSAADHLTPVTLELGGKSPVIIDLNYPLAKAMPPLVVGKLLNAGQSCVAPDYAFVPRSLYDSFARTFQTVCHRLYPDLPTNEDYSAIISDRHWERLQSLLNDAAEKGAQAISLNHSPESTSSWNPKFPPTILLDVNPTMKVLQDEIFGPILPVIPYDNLEEVFNDLREKPRPLVINLFSENKTTIQRFRNESIAGSLCINAPLVHFAQNELPIGGVGSSGMGRYHGYEGFVNFSQMRSLYWQHSPNGVSLCTPPYRRSITQRLLKFLIGT